MSSLPLRMYTKDDPGGAPATVFRTLSQDPYPNSYYTERMGASASVSQRPIISARRTSHFYIKQSFESLNYRPLANQLEFEKQKATSFREVQIEKSLRIGVFLIIGALTAILGVVTELAIEHLGHLKYDTFENIAKEKFNGSSREFLIFVMYRFMGTILPVMVGAGLVTFFAPYAAGGGVAQCVGFLNGIRVPKVLSIRGLVVKALSTICTVISGLAGGKEGPMMHMGAITGGSLPSALPYSEFKLDHERRDFAAAGFGAGLAVVFGAPVGGLLLALEEGVSFLEISLMWKIYLCCVVGFIVGAVVISLIKRGEVDFNSGEMLSLGFISHHVTEYEFFEVVPFAIMAVIGGLVGALLIKIHIFVALFRDRYIKNKTRKMIAAFAAAFIVVVLQVSAIWWLRSCSSHKTPVTIDSNTTHTPHSHQLYCPMGERSDMSLLFSLTQGGILRLFFGPDILQISSLAVFAIIYFVLLSITMGLSISAGIFVPQIILGAAWGRLFGTILNKYNNGSKWARPEKYAYLGAAAQLSGTVGMTFSILVIFVEASGSVKLAFPLMIIVSITRLVCTFFVLPIYETQLHLMGLPFLPHRPPPLDCDIPITRHMSRPPLVTLPPSPTVSTIITTLRNNNHNGYPIVETQGSGMSHTVLIGLILRQQLLILLKYSAFKYPPPTSSKQMCECFETYIKEARKHLDSEEIVDSVDKEYYDVEIDLRPYYNCFPNTVTNDRPMIKTYELFRSLGLRHLVVITKNYEPIGMVTRKDLAKFHTVEMFCKVKVKEMFSRS